MSLDTPEVDVLINSWILRSSTPPHQSQPTPTPLLPWPLPSDTHTLPLLPHLFLFGNSWTGAAVWLRPILTRSPTFPRNLSSLPLSPSLSYLSLSHVCLSVCACSSYILSSLCHSDSTMITFLVKSVVSVLRKRPTRLSCSFYMSCLSQFCLLFFLI